MEKVNLSSLVLGSNVTVTTTETLRVEADGTFKADINVRKVTSGLAGSLKREEKTEDYSYEGAAAVVKQAVDDSKLAGDYLATGEGV